MKVLSLVQPWATLIALGEKSIETRSWKTNYRGTIYLHASGKTDRDFLKNDIVQLSLKDSDVPNGKIIAKCELIDCIEMTDEFINQIKKDKKEYTFGFYEKRRYAWILANIQKLETPIEVKGKLGLWNWDES